MIRLMKSKNFKFAVISDIHVGNSRNTSEEIIANLNREFKDDLSFAELDMIVIAGDIFDNLLNSVDVIVVDVWIARFLSLCKKHNVLLRILKGTPSHDWEQSSRFVYINEEISKIGADLIYFKDLTIWYEERFDMNFLFVPDEWASTTEQTLSQVNDLLKNRGLKQVDYAFMHGTFDFQIADHIKIQKHSSQAYLNIVKHLIFVGHIHNYSNLDRIYAQGSFDRMGHGEEEPKGYLRVTRYPDDHHDVTFIENKGAKRFVTLDYTNLDVESIIDKAKKDTEDLPQGSFVRITAEYKNPIFTNMDVLNREIPHCHWSKNPKDMSQAERLDKELMEDDDIYTPIEIHAGNVKGLLIERLKSQSINSVIHDKALMYLNEFVA